jgi:hypothetical protein
MPISCDHIHSHNPYSLNNSIGTIGKAARALYNTGTTGNLKSCMAATAPCCIVATTPISAVALFYIAFLYSGNGSQWQKPSTAATTVLYSGNNTSIGSGIFIELLYSGNGSQRQKPSCTAASARLDSGNKVIFILYSWPHTR